MSYQLVNTPTPGENFKFCHRCEAWKARSDYYPAAMRQDGLQSYCGQCQRAIRRDSYHRTKKSSQKIDTISNHNNGRATQRAARKVYTPKPKPPSRSYFARLDLTAGLGLYVGQFLNAKAIYSKKTLTGYQCVLGAFAHHAGNKWPIDGDDINSFLAAKKADGCKPVTILDYYRVLASFCNWLMRRKKVTQNPLWDCEKPPRPQPLPRAPKREALASLFNRLKTLAAGGTWIHIRNLAIFSLMLDSGLRVGEVTRLKLTDIDLTKRLAVLRETKTKADGTSVFGTGAAQHLQAWKEARAGLNCPADVDAFFVCISRAKWAGLSVATISQTLTRLCAELDIAHITPHQLRHATAVYSLENGASFHDIQRQLRHADLRMTLRYTMIADHGREARQLEYSPFDKLGVAL